MTSDHVYTAGGRLWLGQQPPTSLLHSLTEAHVTSFTWLVQEGLRELVDEISPITDFTGKNLTLYIRECSLGTPRFTPAQCLAYGLTYAAPLRAQVELRREMTGEILASEIFLGELPLMLNSGTFIYHGIERTVVSQLIRTPGVYFTAERDPNSGRVLHAAKIIPSRGGWLEFETTRRDVINVTIDRTCKLPITILLRAMLGWRADARGHGFWARDDELALTGQNPEIAALLEHVDTFPAHPFIQATLHKDPTHNTKEALLELYKRLRPGDPPTLENAQQVLESLIFNPRRYNLSQVGRQRLARSLWGAREGQPGSGEWATRVLLPADIRKTVERLIQLNNGVGCADDIFSLSHHRLRTVGDQLQQQLRVGLLRLERVVKERMSLQDPETVTPNTLINIRPIVEAVRAYFEDNPLVQVLDQTNALAAVSHLRRFTRLGPGGLSAERAGMDIRTLHHSHYGRLCPLETPGGQAVGLEGSLGLFARVTRFGDIITPYHPVVSRARTAASWMACGTLPSDWYDGLTNTLVARRGTPITPELARRLAVEGLRGQVLREDLVPVWMHEHTVPNRPDQLWGRVLAADVYDLPAEELPSDPEVLVGHRLREPFLRVGSGRIATMLLRTGKLAPDIVAPAGTTISPELAVQLAASSTTVTVVREQIGRAGEVITLELAERLARLPYAAINVEPARPIEAGAYLTDELAEQIAAWPLKEVRITPLVSAEVVYLDAFDEVGAAIAPTDTLRAGDGRFANRTVACRRDESVAHVRPDQVALADLAPDQALGVAASLIPFLAHDDPASALLGIRAMHRALPLLRREAPRVATGTELVVGRDSGQIVRSEHNGTVVSVEGSRVLIAESGGELWEYSLAAYRRTPQGTVLSQRPVVAQGEHVKVGQLLADGSSTDGGELALGQHVVVAYMSWEGANFADGIVVSERVIAEGLFTSLRMHECIVDAHDSKLGPEEITRDLPNVAIEALDALNRDGIITIGATVQPHDLLVGRLSPISAEHLYGEEPMMRAIFGGRAREVRDSSYFAPGDVRGIVVDVSVASRRDGVELPVGVNQRVRLQIVERRRLEVGDLLADRHGMRGVVSCIVPAEDMPCLPSGLPIDVILNPQTVLERLNPGQLLEAKLGLAATVLGQRIATPALGGASETRIDELLASAGLPTSGKLPLWDGRTGETYAQEITVGVLYLMRPRPSVEDVCRVRSTGLYSRVTGLPRGERGQFGGQQLDEDVPWALAAHGAAHTLQELLTIKADDEGGRAAVHQAIAEGEPVPGPGVAVHVHGLVKQLQSLGLKVEVLDEDGREIWLYDDSDDDLAALDSINRSGGGWK